MCGFAGVVGALGEPPHVRTAEWMAAQLSHRGPDDTGSFAADHVALAFRRLSILDLSPNGHQPVLSPDGQVAMVFNGEIFNYAELRDELRALGHAFRSTGDSEVLLAAYLEWGVGCLPRLNGMWAFLVYDGRRGTVVGSRDRFGVKPLYHLRSQGRHYFASEIKALQAVVPEALEVAWPRVAAYLAAGSLESLPDDTATFFRAVSQVEPGTWFEIGRDGSLRTQRYWSLPEEQDDDDDPRIPEGYGELFGDAVSLRLRSDVPVGVSLSGGMDSTAIICAMAKLREARGGDHHADRALHAFSYMSPGHDESQYIHRTIAQTGATLHRVESSAEQCWDGLPEITRFHDEPVHSATAWIGFEIYRAARAAGVPVLLVGQGADETLGGYPSYFPEWWQTLLRRGHLREAMAQMTDFARGHGTTLARAGVGEALRFTLQTAGRLAVYRALMGQRRQRRAYPYRHLLGAGLAAMLPDAPQVPSGDLRQALVHGTTRTPLPLYLRLEDRNSMAHSVEARLPFLDYRLVAMAFRLSGQWKIRGRWNKYLLREATRGLVPDLVRERVDKMGFPTTMAAWFRQPLRARLDDLFRSPEFVSSGLYDPPRARQLLAEHAAGRQDASRALFGLVQSAVWLRGVAERGGRSPRAPD